VTGWWFSLGTLVSSTNKTYRHNITEILLKVALNTINQTNQPGDDIATNPSALPRIFLDFHRHFFIAHSIFNLLLQNCSTKWKQICQG